MFVDVFTASHAGYTVEFPVGLQEVLVRSGLSSGLQQNLPADSDKKLN